MEYSNLVSDKTLRQLNTAIDRVIKEKKQMEIDYDLLEEALITMLRYRRPKEKNYGIIGKRFSKIERVN